MQVKINYKLQNFEGPLDLLLHLISKHQLNINDIEIFELVEQYILYVEKMQNADMDIASEFIDMAARLVYIKTVSLLPVSNEAEKLKSELSAELMEYALCKELAEKLKEQNAGFDHFCRTPVKFKADLTYSRFHEPDVLAECFITVVSTVKNLPPPVSNFAEIVDKKVVSVDERMEKIVEIFNAQKSMNLIDLYTSSKSKSELVANFLAVLELIRAAKLLINDELTVISKIQ